MNTSTIIRSAEDGEATWFFNGLVTTKAHMAETAGAYNIAEHLVTAASNPPMHIHLDEDEAYYVLDGTFEVEIDGQAAVATPGTFAFVPRGSAHTYRVLTDTARMLVICSGKPADNFEDFVAGMGEPATDRVLPEPTAPDEQRLMELYDRIGIAMV